MREQPPLAPTPRDDPQTRSQTTKYATCYEPILEAKDGPFYEANFVVWFRFINCYIRLSVALPHNIIHIIRFRIAP